MHATYKLVEGLSEIINLVEALPDNTLFYPKTYRESVFGTIYKHKINEIEFLYNQFGITRHESVDYFTIHSKRHFSKRQWLVIRLFTPSIGRCINKGHWLKLANRTINKIRKRKPGP